MKNKILIILVVLLAFLGGMFTPKGIAMFRPAVWSQSLPASKPSEPTITNSQSSPSLENGGGGGGMWYSPMKPNYNPEFDWYTLPKDQCENGRNNECWQSLFEGIISDLMINTVPKAVVFYKEEEK